jgi:Sulfotransferase domain
VAIVTKTALDFAVIGAQKSGTGSISQYLRLHPEIHIPLVREAPFFNRDDRYEKGWDWYAGEFFSHAPDDALWGTVSPQYMSDPLVPGRIRETMPEVKLIAVLRNPVHRALSHYRMAVRRHGEDRTFDQAVNELAEEAAAHSARKARADQKGGLQGYLVRGEYARILGSYYELFPKEQIMVIFSEDLLERDPRNTYQDVLRFLEISPAFVPDNLGKRYGAGGTKTRIDAVDKLRDLKTVRRWWRRIPQRRRMIFRRAYVAFNHWRTVTEPPSSSTEMHSQTLARLVDYYRPEVERLRDLLGREVPWPEFR